MDKFINSLLNGSEKSSPKSQLAMPFGFANNSSRNQSIDQNCRTMDKVSEESFLRLEKDCEKTLGGHSTSDSNFLDDVEVPSFDDTLEEVEFILSLGEKLKKEGKIKFPTPNFPSKERQLSVLMEVTAQSSPRSSLLSSSIKRKRLSRIISPISRRGSSLNEFCRSHSQSVLRMSSASPSTYTSACEY